MPRLPTARFVVHAARHIDALWICIWFCSMPAVLAGADAALYCHVPPCAALYRLLLQSLEELKVWMADRSDKTGGGINDYKWSKYGDYIVEVRRCRVL